MYQFHKEKNQHNKLEYVILKNPNHGNTIKICPKIGGALHHLTINNKLIIKEPNKENYNDVFFSSILFPYVNRVEHGTFSFEETTYNLPLNETKEKHAIHGLIYDKEFEVKEYNVSDKNATIKLRYSEESTTKKTLFNYTIDLTYEINKTALNLHINIYNKGLKKFPFNVGWHPFFHNLNKENRTIHLQSDQKIKFDQKMIPKYFEAIETDRLIINKSFDDCYRLKEGKIIYNNEKYSLLLTSSAEVNYLQIFTPKNNDSVAIEFMTSPPNSFNNKVDLDILAPKKHYSIEWSINLISENK